MWIEVVPAVRTPRGQDSFTYLLPDSQPGDKVGEMVVQRGSLVSIPWRHSFVTGIVWKLEVTEPSFPTKPVAAVLDVQLSSHYLDFLQWFAEYYYISLAHLAKLVLPVQPKRVIQRTMRPRSEQIIPVDMQWSDISPEASQLARQMNIQLNTELTMALNVDSSPDDASDDASNDASNTHTVMYTQTAQLISWIRELVRSANQSTAIIVPEESHVQYWQRWLADSQPLTVTGKSNITDTYALWQAIATATKGVYIGTKRLSLFPLTELDRIIVIDPEHPAHKQWDLNPRYQVYAVIRAMARKATRKASRNTSRCQAIYCSQAPRFDQYNETQVHTELAEVASLSSVTIVDMQMKESSLAHGFISPSVMEALDRTETAFLYFNRKGSTRFMVCLQCHAVISAMHITTCSTCQSQSLAERGVGTAMLQADVQALFPDRLVIELTKDINPAIAIPYAEYPIIIGTTYAHSTLDWSRIEYIAVLSIDSQLAMPHYRNTELVWQELVRLRNYTQQFTVQTMIPENPLFGALSQVLPDQWIQQQLAYRQVWNVPPYGVAMQLRHRDTNEVKMIQNESDVPKDPAWLIDRDE